MASIFGNTTATTMDPKLFDGDDKITVDQAYNPKSKNAQSGKAVAEAIANIGGQEDYATKDYVQNLISSVGSGGIKSIPVADLPTKDIDPTAIYLKAVTNWLGSTGGWTNGAITIAVANLQAVLADAKYVRLVVKRQDDATFTVEEAKNAITFITNDDEVGNPIFSKGTIDNGVVHNGISNRAYTASLHFVSNYKSISVANGWAVWAHLYNGDRFEEYLYIDETWELIGGASVEVNLDDYVKNTDYAANGKAGIVKINNAYGIRVSNNNELMVDTANDSEIAAKKNINAPLKPHQIDKIVRVGVTTNTIALTEEEKTAAMEWLGIKQYIDDAIAQLKAEL